MCNKYPRFGWFFCGVPMFLIFLALGALIVMLLWNALLPEIFGFRAIDYLQAAGLLVLTKILFGGFGRGHRHFYGRYHRCRHEADNESADKKEEPKKSQ